jgi:hypothetical protein
MSRMNLVMNVELSNLEKVYDSALLCEIKDMQ